MIHRKVLHVINSLDVGGAEALLVNFIRYAPKNYSVEVCVLYPSGALRQPLALLGIPLYDLHLFYKYDMTRVCELIKLIQSNQYDIVHAHLFPSVLLTALASRKAKGPCYICTEHGTWNRRRKFFGFRYLDRWIYSHYSKVICVSPTVRQSLAQWAELELNRMVVIPSGVMVSEEDEGHSVPTYDLIFVGRLEYEKGLDILFHALVLLRQRRLHPRLLIVGAGSQSERLRGLAARLQLSSQVVFVGYQSDVRRFLREARIFVLPSRTEGLPVSLLEAMATGKGIIATSSGGIVDAVENNQEAILVPPGDASALADAIAKMLEEPQRLQSMGRAAQARARSLFSVQRYVRETIELYEKVLE
ncbi:MAG: glycosyltransferase [Candidatus Methanomethylicaceae archaeon]